MKHLAQHLAGRRVSVRLRGSEDSRGRFDGASFSALKASGNGSLEAQVTRVVVSVLKAETSHREELAIAAQDISALFFSKQDLASVDLRTLKRGRVQAVRIDGAETTAGFVLEDRESSMVFIRPVLWWSDHGLIVCPKDSFEVLDAAFAQSLLEEEGQPGPLRAVMRFPFASAGFLFEAFTELVERIDRALTHYYAPLGRIFRSAIFSALSIGILQALFLLVEGVVGSEIPEAFDYYAYAALLVVVSEIMFQVPRRTLAWLRNLGKRVQLAPSDSVTEKEGGSPPPDPVDLEGQKPALPATGAPGTAHAKSKGTENDEQAGSIE